MSNLQDSVLFTPYRLGQVTLRNRTIRSAAFESMGKDFSPTQQLKDYHVSVARGGIGMTTLAYAAVCRSGLSFKSQLWLRPEIVPALRDITDAIHKEVLLKVELILLGGLLLKPKLFIAVQLLHYLVLKIYLKL